MATRLSPSASKKGVCGPWTRPFCTLLHRALSLTTRAVLGAGILEVLMLTRGIFGCVIALKMRLDILLKRVLPKVKKCKEINGVTWSRRDFWCCHAIFMGPDHTCAFSRPVSRNNQWRGFRLFFARIPWFFSPKCHSISVSYTHLTLPTKRIV